MMRRETSIPSIPSIIKICDGFGITLAQFFSPEDETAKLTADQKDCLDLWTKLSTRNKELASIYMKGLADGQESEKK